MKTVEERFFEKVHINTNTGCWEWEGNRDPGGYGTFRFKGKGRKAHRVAYEMTGKKIKGTNFVCHACDNPCCVNPFHLFQGTRKQNIEDMVRKGRSTRGEKGWRARLNDHEVKIIKIFLDRFPPTKNRSSVCHGGVKFLSRWFDVHDSAITRIHQGKRWSHIK